MSSAVEHVELPGVGVRSTFSTQAGLEVGVLTHQSGTRDVLVYAEDDPDRCSDVMSLEPAEAQAMADLLGTALGGSPDRMLIGPVAVGWVEVGAGWWIEGQALDAPGLEPGKLEARLLGVVRGDLPQLPAEVGPLRATDVVIVAGLQSNVDNTARILELGP